MHCQNSEGTAQSMQDNNNTNVGNLHVDKEATHINTVDANFHPAATFPTCNQVKQLLLKKAHKT